MDIKVSVIIPVYNVEDYISETLDSLMNQTIKDFEIIIINDGSTDKSLEIIEGYMNKHKNIVLIIPIYLIECIAFVYFCKYIEISNLIVIFLALIFITIITFKLFNKLIPFAIPFDFSKKDDSKVTIYLIIILILIMAGIHLLFYFIGSTLVNIYLLVLLLLDIFLLKTTFK